MTSVRALATPTSSAGRSDLTLTPTRSVREPKLKSFGGDAAWEARLSVGAVAEGWDDVVRHETQVDTGPCVADCVDAGDNHNKTEVGHGLDQSPPVPAAANAVWPASVAHHW